MPQTPIAVVGMACRFPQAPDLPSFWRLVRSGAVAFGPMPAERWNHSSFFAPTDLRAPDTTYIGRGGYLEDLELFPALHYGLAPRRVQVTDPQQRLAIEAVRQAMCDAGYDRRPFDRSTTGVFMGASVSEFKDLMTVRHRAQQLIDGAYGEALEGADAQAVRAAVADMPPLRAFSITGSSLNMIACSVAQTFDFNGPAMQLDTACSSALVAVHQASLCLRAGECDVAFAGGVYLNLSPDNLVGFARIGAISPSGECRPFDQRADGFVMGEGIGVVMLKRLDDALRDHDRVYAVLKGSAVNNDGRGEGPMTPKAAGQHAAMRRAHRETSVPVESIGYVETHGTATSVGDVTEVGALKAFFAERGATAVGRTALGSVKANVGHTMSAAGIAGFIKTCLMIERAVLPVQPGCEELNPRLELEGSPFFVVRQSRAWVEPAGAPRRAAVSAFGFGGTNAHVLLEQAPAGLDARLRGPAPMVLSAPSADLLRRYAAELRRALAEGPYSVAALSRTLSLRQRFEVQAHFLAERAAEVDEALAVIAEGGPTNATASPGVAPDDATLLTLPPPPLESESYWLKERAPRRVRRSAPSPVAAPLTPVLEPVLSLFAQQLGLLQSQAELVRAQTLAAAAATAEASGSKG